MIDLFLVQEADDLAMELILKLRELYKQSGDNTTDQESKLYCSGLMRGVFDLIEYCKVGE